MRKGKWLVLVGTLSVLVLVLSMLPGCGSKTPEITSISPSSGGAGEEVTITGTNFGESQGSGVVNFGSELTGDIQEWNDTKVMVKVPEDLKDGEYKVSVTNDSGETSETVSFTVTTEEDQLKEEVQKEAEEKEEAEKEEEEAQKEQALAVLQTIMLEYAEANAASDVGDIKISNIQISEDGKTATADVSGVYTSGPNEGQPTETVQIKAENQDGTWKVVDMGDIGSS